MSVEQAKKDLLNTMASIDRDKLSLHDLMLYAQTLQIVSHIESRTYTEQMLEMFGKMGDRREPKPHEGFACGILGGAL